MCSSCWWAADRRSEDMRWLTTQMQLDSYVEFLGRVPDQTLLEVLNTADVCVNCDEVNRDERQVHHEQDHGVHGAGQAHRAVRARGGPLLRRATPRSMHDRTMPSDFADKIVTLLDDPERRERMGRFGRDRVERRLAWKYEVPKLLAAYAALFAPAPKPRRHRLSLPASSVRSHSRDCQSGIRRGHAPRKPRSSPEP